MSISSTAGTVYLWDVLYPKLRVRLLKSVNYTLTSNESLSWMSLPMNVQNDLLDLKFNFSKNHKLDNIAAEILVILEEVRFDLLISVDLLKEKISSIIFDRIDRAIAFLQSSTYAQPQKHASCKGASKKNGKNKIFFAKLKRHDSNEQSDEFTTTEPSDFKLRGKRSAESGDSEESNESSGDDNEEEDYDLELRRKRSAESEESGESNESSEDYNEEEEDYDQESRRKRSVESGESEESNERSDEDEDEYMEWRRKRASGSNINKDKSEQHGKEHKASNQKKELVKKSKHEKKTNEHHVEARAAGQHGKALEHANEHAKSHIGGQTGHAKALEHANEHAKSHIGGHNIETRAAEEENKEETHEKSQKGAKHQKKEHIKKDKHEKKTHKNEQQYKDVLAAAHGKALENQLKVRSAYKGYKTHATKTVYRTTPKV